MRQALRTALTTLLALGLPAGLVADGYQPDPRFERVAVEEGLPDHSVTRILQDHLGFLWLGTHNGLVKYDGYTYTTYKPDPGDPYSLSGRSVIALHEDSRGDLWIGTRRGGLNRFDRASGTFTHWRHDPDDPRSLSFDAVAAILEDSSGDLWVGTGDIEIAVDGGGLDKLDRATGSFTHFRHDPDDPASLSHDIVGTLHEDRQGRLWVTTPLRGLNLLDRQTGTFTRFGYDADDPTSLVSNYVSALVEDADGSLWIGTWGDGLHRFDPATGASQHHTHDPENPRSLANDTVLSLFRDSSGLIWVGTYLGPLHRFDPATGVFSRFEHDPEDPISPSDHSGVLAVSEDSAGILWFGTYGGGLNKLDRYASKFHHIRHEPGEPQSLVHRRVNTLHLDSGGRLWIGTDGGIDRFDPGTQEIVTLQHDPEDPSSLSDDRVWSIHEDSGGAVWIGTQDGGLNRWDPETQGLTHFRRERGNRRSLSTDFVTAVHEDAGGVLWVGTGGGGLHRLDRATGKFTRYRHESDDPRSLSHDWVLTVVEDAAGTLWVGTDAGLNRLDRETDDFTRFFSPEDGLDIITAIYEDSGRRLWIGTALGGLHLFDRETGTSEAFTEQDGLANDKVLAVVEDAAGRLWLNTGAGVSRFDPGSERFRNYSTRDGLQRQLSRGAARMAGGELLFAGTDGINVIAPDAVEDNPHPPPVALTDFKILNRSERPGPDAALAADVSVAREIDLGHEQNVVTFEFAGLHFGHPEANRYAYRLEGFDEDWIETDGRNRSATYTNLAPGSYTFWVRAASSVGVWNKEGVSIAVHVHPPWWRTGWAHGVYFVLAFAAIVAVDRMQRARVVRKERQRARQQEIRLRAEAAELQARAAEAQAVALQAENDRKSRELEKARRLQLSMLPDSVPWHPEVEIAAFMKTATEVGGDYYDFDIADDGTLTVAIGDATGHGTVAGTMVTATKSLFHLLAAEADPVEVLKSSTVALKRMQLDKLYMALALAKLKDRVLAVANAGMPPTLVYRAASGIVEEIAVDGMPLGGQIRFPYEKRSVDLAPGDVVVFMSDGFPEMTDGDGEIFGYGRLEEALSTVAARRSPQGIIDHLVDLAEGWRNGSPPDDDMTFVVMKVRDGAAAETAAGEPA